MLSVLLIVSIFGKGNAQRFKALNSEISIPPTHDFYEDKEGFLWLETQAGLLRYDGYEVKHFRHNPSDPHSPAGNNITKLQEDHRGRLWIGYFKHGLDILDKERQEFTHICLSYKTDSCDNEISVYEILPIGKDKVWVGSSEGLFLCSQDSSLTVDTVYRADLQDPKSLSSSGITKLYRDWKGNLWIGTFRGLNRYLPTEEIFINHNQNPSYPAVQILDIDEDAYQNLWVSPRHINACLMEYLPERDSFRAPPQFKDRTLGNFRLVFDKWNNIWISARKVGAYKATSGKEELRYFDPLKSQYHGYSNVHGANPFLDRWGNVWFSGNKTLKFPASHKDVQFIPSNQGTVEGVFALNDQLYYSDNSLHHFELKKLIFINDFPWHNQGNVNDTEHRNTKEKFPQTHAFKKFEEDQILISEGTDIYIWNLKENTFEVYKSGLGGPFRDVALTPQSDGLWIAANQGSPVFLDFESGQFNRPGALKEVQNSVTVERDSLDRFWWGSQSSGVFLVDQNSSEIVRFHRNNLDSDRLISDNKILDIEMLGDTAWIATSLGMNKINILTLKSEKVLFEEQQRSGIVSLESDKGGLLWMGTQNGLKSYNPKNGQWKTYDSSDGLGNKRYTPRTVYKDDNGILYFGGEKGIDYFDPSSLGINEVPPLVYLSQVKINGLIPDSAKAMHHIKELKLRHDQNYVEVRLLALHLTDPLSNRYAYRIAPLDTAWRMLGTNRTVSLANLSPGEYMIEAKASNADGVWSQDKSLLKIIITPPFYKTWWFLLSCFLFLTGMIVAMYRYRILQIRRQEKLKTDFNKKLAEMESKALRAQMNPHFLYNSINSVKSLVSRRKNDMASQYITQFGELMRLVLSNSEKQLVRLDKELKALKLYLEIEKFRFKNFNYTIDVAENLDIGFIEIPSLIIQPYVENALWHGLMNKPTGERNLLIKIYLHNTSLHIIIRDNGIGRQKSREIRKRGKGRKRGIGMRLTSSRLELIKKTHKRSAKVEVKDLYEEGKSVGTEVEIVISQID